MFYFWNLSWSNIFITTDAQFAHRSFQLFVIVAPTTWSGAGNLHGTDGHFFNKPRHISRSFVSVFPSHNQPDLFQRLLGGNLLRPHFNNTMTYATSSKLHYVKKEVLLRYNVHEFGDTNIHNNKNIKQTFCNTCRLMSKSGMSKRIHLGNITPRPWQYKY